MTNRKFGVEIELTGTSENRVVTAFRNANIPMKDYDYDYDDEDSIHAASPKWKIVEDGSLSDGGFEVVSPILSGAEGMSQLVLAVHTLVSVGAVVDRSCGLHVHVDARQLNIQTIANIVYRYSKFENQIDSFMPPSRRRSNSEYCNSVRSMFEYGPPLNEMISRGKRVLGSYDRYHKVNLAAYARHGTIEFRQHSGTVNAMKIKNWVQFCLEFVEASVLSSSLEEVPDMSNDNLFRDINPAVAAYYRERMESFSTRQNSI